MRHTEMSGGTGVVSCDLVQNCPFFLSLSLSPPVCHVQFRKNIIKGRRQLAGL